MIARISGGFDSTRYLLNLGYYTANVRRHCGKGIYLRKHPLTGHWRYMEWGGDLCNALVDPWLWHEPTDVVKAQHDIYVTSAFEKGLTIVKE